MQTPLAYNVVLSIVCPFYNEEAVIDLFFREIHVVLGAVGEPFEIVCVNDGSTDKTLEKLLAAKQQYPNIRILNLSRNFGKEAALTAGLDHAEGQAVIPIDADLQDPPYLIRELVKQWKNGFEVVLAKRADRSQDSLAKMVTANWFYKIHNKISHIDVPANVGDCRLMSRKVLDAVQQLPENQRFMKGIFAWVGFKPAIVEYQRDARKAGETSFNGWKLWNLALDGITSFSTVPLRIWLYLGLAVSLLSFVYGSFIVLRTLVVGVDLPGYASLFTAILFLGGVQLIGIGVLGEYIGRMYMESKRRPVYIIEQEY